MFESKDEKNIVEQGFTLVELLIVVVVLGILAGIVVFAVGNLSSDAQDSACLTDHATLETAIEAAEARGVTDLSEGNLETLDYIKGDSDYWDVNAAGTISAQVGAPATCTP